MAWTSKPWTSIRALALALALALAPRFAFASRPTPSMPPIADTDPIAAPETATPPPGDKRPDRLEYGVLPALNYDSDLGFGFGVVGTLAKFDPDPRYRPYRWRLGLLAYATVKRKPGGGAEFPYHYYVLETDFPGLAGGKLRLGSRAGFRRFSNAGYYGLGNASVATRPWEAIDADAEPEAYAAARRYHQYDRIFPYADLWARIIAWDRSNPIHKRRLEVFVGAGFVYSVVNLYPGSKLEQDAALAREASDEGRALARLLHGTEDHGQLRASTGLLVDTRDHEYTPTRGTFTELSVRGSLGTHAPSHYAGLTLNSSWYAPLVGEHLVVAIRGVGDALLGNPPVWALASFGAFIDKPGPGGAASLRGVPRQRLHGKLKLISNVELRSMFWRFAIKKQRFHVGALAFLDAGRVWADARRTIIAGAALDDSLLHWSLGVGGGLRIKWGETFVVRADVGVSPTEANNVGFYIDVAHIF